MTMNKNDINSLHKKAEKERLRQAAAAENKGKKVRPFIPLAAGSKKIFYKIYPYRPNIFLWTMLPLFAAVTGWVMFAIDRKANQSLLPYTIAATCLPVIVYLITILRIELAYPGYKNWLNRIGFAVNGWDHLGQSEKFLGSNYWDDMLQVEIVLINMTDDAALKLSADALFLFTVAANKTFYTAEQAQAGLAGDIRKKWKTLISLTAAGSANLAVMGKLYHFINIILSGIHKQQQNIKAVNLTFSNHLYEITPERTSD
jgi:hypothetical protein